MTLEELLLTREEVVIPNPDMPFFVCPIHLKILELPVEVRTDSTIARSVFPDIYPWFMEDLLRSEAPTYVLAIRERLLTGERTLFRGVPGGKGTPLFLPDFFNQVVCRMGLSRDVHVYYRPPEDVETRINSNLFAVSLEKAREYCGESLHEMGDVFSGHCHMWLTHNVEAYQAAVVLRDWCILYHNKLLRLAFELQPSD